MARFRGWRQRRASNPQTAFWRSLVFGTSWQSLLPSLPYSNQQACPTLDATECLPLVLEMKQAVFSVFIYIICNFSILYFQIWTALFYDKKRERRVLLLESSDASYVAHKVAAR